PKTVLVGISMGGAACWLAVERARADAIVSEGSFAVLDDAVRRWFDLLLPGGHVILAPVRWLAKVRSGVDPSTVRPVDGAARWRGRPALVIQGDRDRLMEMSQAKTLSEAAGCPLWVVPGAEHAQCQNLAPAEYVRRLSELADALAH
ncbi:MAG: alpha/beta hydrolase, partial [Fimbriimonas ginsengisoli]|nr:alpha/beta hydrolase [Fimbriimonas ginsengisoli]